MKHLSLSFRVLSLCALAAGLTACVNLFDPIDNPSGDRQTLSAARAAFDKGDIAQARELYGKIATNENAKAETIFLDLDSCGADIGAFGSALSKGTDSAGMILTIMAEKMVAQHGTACLARLLAAYQSSLTLTDANLKGFTGFLAAISIAGEVLAHNSGVQDGTLMIADYVTSPSTNCAACAADACAVSDGLTTQATQTLSSATSITATFGTIQGAINAANTALGQMGISSGPSYQLMQQFGAAVSTSQSYRCILHSAGVGR